MAWSAERIAELCRLWTVEGLSASQIGGALLCTRNAVIGKLHRLGLMGASKPATSKSSPRFERRRPARVIAGVAIEVDIVSCNPLPFLDLRIEDIEAGQCKYPRDEQFAAPYTFCGQPTGGPDAPYCEYHRHRCCVPLHPMRNFSPYARGYG